MLKIVIIISLLIQDWLRRLDQIHSSAIYGLCWENLRRDATKEIGQELLSILLVDTFIVIHNIYIYIYIYTHTHIYIYIYTHTHNTIYNIYMYVCKCVYIVLCILYIECIYKNSLFYIYI